ncbi:sugar phosphate isomerase/epimerase family protein [Ramlibacter sp. AN1015]|uniref:sugar phosphate isomerase/epimerase family protein n=1 Tax=Ramlibacter sp. AN1015 TaxID=3133428 RepID=UPI0030C3A46D
MEPLEQRIGVDLGRRLPLEDGVRWAHAQGVRFVDVELDVGANALETFDARRCEAAREVLAAAGISLRLHTLSAVNVAEVSLHVRDGVDRYLEAYVDCAARLGAAGVVVHAGYHFGKDKAMRMQAALARLTRAADHAERAGVVLLLENLNKEPEDAEVHYLAHTVQEWRYFYEQISSPALRLSFTANHAHLVPEGVEGFLAAIPLERVDEIRLADCWRNGVEQHLRPGQGDMDFGALFAALDARGWRGPFINAFGTLEDMVQARAFLADAARAAGVA